MKEIRKRNEVPKEASWATEDIFQTPGEWEQAMEALKQELGQYETYRGHLADGAEKLYGCLRFDEHVSMELDRLYSYAHLNAVSTSALRWA